MNDPENTPPDERPMSRDEVNAALDELAKTQPQLAQIFRGAAPPEAVRAELERYARALVGGPENVPMSGDPRVNLALAVIQSSEGKALGHYPRLMRAVGEVLVAALTLRPVDVTRVDARSDD